MTLHIMDIQRFSIHDGPGIRTTVFLQGCPLHCPWCANPESQKIGPRLMYLEKKCVGCGRCAAACPNQCIAFENGKPHINRACCQSCGACADACLTHALHISGRQMTVEQVVALLLRDGDYYRHSGGGITVSGGEPFVQAEGLIELLKRCKAEGLHTALETTGQADGAAIREAIPLTDLWLYDLKHPDAKTLKRVTGGDLALILQNLSLLPPEKVVLRVPVIPGFNFDEQALRAIYGIAIEHGIRRVDLLAYHTLGRGKYDQLGMPYEWNAEKSLAKEALDGFKAMGTAMGLTVN